MQRKFVALPTDAVRALQAGGPDAYGHAPRLKVSDGDEVPCRHCLRDVPAGARYLVLAYRPFAALHPYAETGPIFLCADACERAAATARLPQILSSPDYIVRGYDGEEAIVYGTGAVTERGAHHNLRRRALGERGGRVCPRALGSQQLLPMQDRAGRGYSLIERHDPPTQKAVRARALARRNSAQPIQIPATP